MTMKQARVTSPEEPLETVPAELRRSSRTHRATKFDDYLIDNAEFDELIGQGLYEEDCYPKRKRKNHRYDDSEDYYDGHRNPKKSSQLNFNKVEGLLSWKKVPPNMQFSRFSWVSEGEGPEKQVIPTEEFCVAKTTKNVVTENLGAIAQDVEAIFINIDWGKKGQTLKDFQQLKLESNRLMSKGLVFVWAPKEYISELLAIMEKKEFVYVQNLQVIKLDFQKAINFVETTTKTRFPGTQIYISEQLTDIWPVVKCLEHANPCDLISDVSSEYFNRSKQTLLMFKKNNSLKFQLRHQRTCDVVFDMPLKPNQKCTSDVKSYVYTMIETLLPDCFVLSPNSKGKAKLKMLQLWADHGEPRQGWIRVIQE